MDSLYNDIFYDVDKLSLNERIDLIENAFEIAYDYHIDILDCSKSFARQRTNMSFEDIMNKFNMSCHFIFIHRRGYESWKYSSIYRWKLEIGFSTLKSPNYFLFIYVDEKHIDYLIKKYNLKPRI